MAGVLAALVAGCTSPQNSATPIAAEHEPVAEGSGTAPPPAAGKASASGGSATRRTLPAVPVPRPALPTTAPISAGGDLPEPSTVREPEIAAQVPDTPSVRPTVGPDRAADSAGEEARYDAGVDATKEKSGSSAQESEVLAMLRDRSVRDGDSPRGGSGSPPRTFSRSTIDDCTVIRRLGDAMAISRSRGAPESEAVRDGIDRLVGDFGLPRDQRTKFTSRVYGILLYRLEGTHTVQALASYARAICRVYRDTNQIIPVDPVSEREINDRLRTCDGTTAVREELEDCILKGLLEIVSRAT